MIYFFSMTSENYGSGDNSKKINIVPKIKNTGEDKISVIPKTSNQVIRYKVGEKEILFQCQLNVADCGPLSVINGVNFLEALRNVRIKKDYFPHSTESFRRLIATGLELPSFKTIEERKNILQHNTVCDNLELAGVMNKHLDKEKIIVLGSSFDSSAPGFSSQIEELTICKNSDLLLIRPKNNFHFFSMVKTEQNTWLKLDSMFQYPTPVSQVDFEGIINGSLVTMAFVLNKPGRYIRVIEKRPPTKLPPIIIK